MFLWRREGRGVGGVKIGCEINPLDAMDISLLLNSLNKQKLTYNTLTPSIIAIYKFLWTYGGSGHIYICPWLAMG